MSLRDLVEGEAMMDDDENDEEAVDDYDGEVREGAGTVNHYNDSSEEDEDEDDDEEAARQVSLVSTKLVLLQSLTLGACDRSVKASLLMRMKRSRSALDGGAIRSVHGLAKKSTLTKRI